MSTALTLTRIPPELAGDLLKRSAAGDTFAVISVWLREAHGIEVSPRTVQHHVQRLRRLFTSRGSERSTEAAAQARELAAPEIRVDLDALDELRKRAADYEKTAASKGDLQTALAAIREQRAAIMVAIRAAVEDETRRKLDELEAMLGDGDAEWTG